MNEPTSPSRYRQGGQHIVITGAGTGIGRAIALRLAEEGARVSLFGRREDLLQKTAKLAAERGADKIHHASLDIRDRNAVHESFQEACRSLGPLRAVIANSGIGGANGPGPEDRFGDLIDTNLTGTYSCLRAGQVGLAPGPDARHLVVISSILARIGVPGYTGYCASKAGLTGLVRALSAELAGDNVQVNAVCPGWVDTEMAWEGIDGMAQALGITRDEAHRQAMQAVPLGRMSQPEEIAGLVAWLISSDAIGVTGQSIDVNNGAFMI